MIAGIARGSHGELGDLYAAWSTDVEHPEPRVGASRFAARLAPFGSESEACRALLAEGAEVETVMQLTRGAGTRAE